MARIGVFGLMGSGKSTVCRWFRGWGASLVEGDALGWETLREPAVVRELGEAFGAAIRGEDGAVDRARLGSLVFADAEAMARLNAIVQPRLLARVRAALDAAARPGAKPGTAPAPAPVVLDAAMLTTWGLEPELDGVLEIRAPEAMRAERLVRARGFAPEEARRRVRGQRLPPVRGARRHWAIDNDGDEASLRRSAESVWKEIVALP